jgi:uncharacterized delta-60 repeat protein
MGRHIVTRIRASSVAALGLVLAAGLVGAQPAAAGPPVLDPTFGTGGLVTRTDVQAFGAVVDMPDGGVVAASWLDMSQFDPAAGLIARYSATGQPVGSFGTGGVVRLARTDYVFGANHLEHAPGGRLVVFGDFRNLTGTSCGALVVRIDAATGVLDPTFGSGGTLLRALGGLRPCSNYIRGTGGTVLPDGRLMVTFHYRVSGPQMRAAVLALTSTGAPDTGFGGGTGRVTLPVPVDHVGRPHVAADGRIVIPVMGYTPTDRYGSATLGAIRLLPSGIRDTGFSGDGIALRRPFGNHSAPGSVDAVLQPGGRVVVAAGFNVGPYADEFRDAVAVVRYTGTGRPDLTFDAGRGYARIPTMYVGRVDRAPDGSIVIAGSQNEGPLDAAFPPFLGRAARTSADGVPDPTFGPGGVRDVKDAGTTQSVQVGLAVDPAGVLTFAGWRNTNDSTDGASAAPQPTLTRFTTGPALARAVGFESGLASSRGLFRSCGTTIAAACPIGTTWYFQGSAWPLESHDPSRVAVQLDRRGGDGLWHRVSSTTVFVTDDGNFRGTGRPASVGLYRIRAAVPVSASTRLSYGSWRYLKR